jgi:diacylglycerol kinase family enzyme
MEESGMTSATTGDSGIDHYRQRLQRLRVVSARALPVHADGEICTTGATQVEIEIMPDALLVMAPVPENLSRGRKVFTRKFEET